MEPARKRGSFLDLFRGMDQALRELLYEQPRDWLIQAREKMRDLPKTNFDLGCRFAEERKWYDALFRFRVTLYLQPNYPQALYNLGCCYFQIGKKDKARVILNRVVRESPTNQDALFMLAAIDPSSVPLDRRPQEIPRQTVVNFFSGLAEEYNIIEAQNQYRGGAAIMDVLKPLLPAALGKVVDLGCGSGIAAIPFRPLAVEMIGVDATPAMVVQAKLAGQPDKPIYNQVIEADITRLEEAIVPESADLVLIVNVVQFIGKLDTTLANAARLTKQGGLVAITVEPYTGTDGFGLSPETGRFGHSPAYVRRIAATYGLTPVKDARVALYAETTAELLIFGKGAR